MCRCFCTGFINFMLKGKSLLGYKILFYAKIFSITKKVQMKKLYCVVCSKYRRFKKPKLSYIFEKTLVLSVIYSKCKNKDEKKF